MDKKILLLGTPRLPSNPASSAGKLLVFKILEFYNKKYNVILISRYNYDEDEYLAQLKEMSYKSYFIGKGFSRIGFINTIFNVFSWIKYFFYLNFVNLKYKIDIIQLEWIESCFFFKNFKKVLYIIDTHDVRFELLSREVNRASNIFVKVKYKCQYIVMKRIELCTLKTADLILTKSDYDKQIFLFFNDKLNIKLLRLPIKDEFKDIIWSYDYSSKYLLFIGELTRHENIISLKYLLNDIWPHFSNNNSDFSLKIIGKNPPAKLLSISKIDPKIEFLGFIPNLVNYFLNARILIAPLIIGGGIIMKIFDSMSIGLPVITTNYGNQGIGAQNGKEIIIAENAEQFITVLNSYVNDKKKMNKLSLNSRKFILNQINFEKELEEIYYFIETKRGN